MAKISRVRVQNFRSIIDSGWIELDSEITTIVGSNEAGKSNFLEAIAGFYESNSYNPEEDLCSYNSDEWRGKDLSEIPIVSVEYSDLSLYEAPYTYVEPMLGPITEDPIPSQNLIVTKMADGTRVVSPNEKEFTLKEYISKKRELFQETVKLSQTNNPTRYRISAPGYEIEATKEELEQHNDTMGFQVVELAQEYKKGKTDYIEYLPKFEMFGEIEPLANYAKFSEADSVDHNPAYRELLAFADLSLDSISSFQNREIHTKEKKTEEELSTKLAKYWGQSKLNIDIQFSPSSVSIHFYDKEENHTTVADRSTGMRWFLSFFFQLIASTSDDLQNNVILLDDPGVHLHPEGHRNLLDAFENLAEDNQIIYCTHSPSLIDNDHIERIRVFERTPEEGTTVTSDLREATKDDDLDVLAPVRQSLGADISGSLFGSTKNVLVEGYTDKLYLNTFSEYFRRQGEDATFDYQTSLVDVDGSKTEYMVRFLDAEGYDYAVLLDDDDGQGAQSHKETLVEKDVDEDRIILVSDVLDDADEDAPVEIEDLLPAEIFCEVVAEEYPDDVDLDELVEATGEDYNTMPDAVKAKLQEIEQGELEEGAFDKGEIAETICDRIASGEAALGDRTVELFESLIEELSVTLEDSN